MVCSTEQRSPEPARRLGAHCLLALCVASAPPAQAVSYTRDIRPILSENCFRCHGPDESARKAKMRLDMPGGLPTAEFVGRITSRDRDVVMPPPRSGKALSATEIELLQRWIDAGARYERHWSFVPPQRPPLPAIGDTADSGPNPIDHFIRRRLHREGIGPSPAADRLTLVRRVHLDLIGLPPTPEVADAFAADPAPDAYQRLVDRLLVSPHYGERWGRRWLDLARYADTNGYEKDRPRSIWPYRDWVIRALNADMPFDQFTVEQIAGDMLPNATADQRTATGFHRNTMLNEEGGIDPLEFRFHAMTDRVATTGTVFLGLTLGCAQCHTHKFDPVTHRDYYRLMAFLNNADEPDYFIPDATAESSTRQRRLQAHELRRSLPTHWPANADALEDRRSAWLVARRAEATRWNPLRPVRATSNLPLLTVEDNAGGDAPNGAADGAVVFVSGDTTKHDTYQLGFAGADDRITALRLEALPDERLPARGPGMTYYEGRAGDFFLSELRIRAAGLPVPIQSATQSYAKNRFSTGPVGAMLATDGDLQTGWSVDGRTGERHVAVFLLAEPIAAGTPLEVEMHFGRHFASSLGRFRISTTARPGGGAALALGAKVERALAMSAGDLTATDVACLHDAFLFAAPELAEPAEAIRRLESQVSQPTTLVLRERSPANPRPTHRHHRGEFLQPKERVNPGVPKVLHKLPPGAPPNRLGFARWLVARDNPLAARVVVNRHWAALFGTGLVRTLEDFGAQGELPSHPELLDWLAVEFMERGWSVKQLHRLIVTSATYRQSSALRPDLLARDPSNRLLARAPRLRVDAEVLRDAALSAAGVLSDRMFGPPVRPPQPAGVTEVAYGGPTWTASQGDDRYRRSIYTFAKRTAPFALYTTFDAPSGESCTARRGVSNTALQALTLLNDPMMVEVAQALGRALAAREDTAGVDATLERAFRRVLTRPPTRAEFATLRRFVDRHRTRFAGDAVAAAKVAGCAGDRVAAARVARSAGDDLARCATWTAVARALLSLDETITRS